MSKQIKIQKFRTNDLNPGTGKQIEFGNSWCEDFFKIPSTELEKTLTLSFIPLSSDYQKWNGKIISLKLSNVTGRSDRKAYCNGNNGYSQLKDFFVTDLKLTEKDNLSDYFALLKISDSEYNLYYVPNLLYSNFVKFFEDETLNINTVLAPKEALTNYIGVGPLQQITYGAPGTGKSYGINKAIKNHSVIRTTFHPDSDYSTFVGAYKPVVEEVDARVIPVVLNAGATFEENKGTYKEKRISYKFVKQAFLKAYLSAWKKYVEGNMTLVPNVKPQFLVIEEINRGNCAQIFGDIFQLLDRGDNMFSCYPIEVDTDIQNEIANAFANEDDYKLPDILNVDSAIENYTSNYGLTLSEDIRQGHVMLLPPNLYIWATMNTSDQSLFPIDSAFKRRWNWKYVKISDAYKTDIDGNFIKDENGKRIRLAWSIKGEGYACDWWTFIKELNPKIYSATGSDDKKLGYFFCKPKNNSTIIDEDTFVSKVVFYLWNDVFKDNEYSYTFDDFYKEDIETGMIVTKSETVKKFITEVVGENNVITESTPNNVNNEPSEEENTNENLAENNPQE